MKIRLIEPDAPSMHLWSASRFVRLGLPMIGAALKEAGHDVRIYAPQIAPVDWSDVHDADLVGLSSTTSTAPETYEIADALRRRDQPVIVGGSHVTFLPDEALDHADYVARGEGGDALMLELIAALSNGHRLEDIKGLSYRTDGQIVHNEIRPPCPDLDGLPVPDLSLIAGHERLTNVPIMTSWGCPFDCTFCSVTAMFGKKYRFRSAENVVAEIKQKQPRRIFFYDDNFAANRKRLKQLLSLMIQEGITVPWGAQVRTDVVRDQELLELMRASGADFVALGLESVDQATLDGFEKSQSIADIEHAIRKLHEYGIRSHGMFVLGADTDRPGHVRETVAFARRNQIDTVMLNILTPLPGTQQFQDLEAEGRIIERDWRLYDAQHVVFAPRQMRADELMRETLRANRRFYHTLRPVRAFHHWFWHGDKWSWNRMLEYGWMWWYARMWYRDGRNRVHLRRLREFAGRLRPERAKKPA